jgi:hypothetical protein
MNFDEFNKYYQQNPPFDILDDLGVKHVKEISPPGQYEFSPCKCGKIHPVDSDTWYHEALKLNEHVTGVYRACKECRELLSRRLVNSEVN